MLGMKCLLFALWVTVVSSIPIGKTRTCLNSKSSCFLKVLKCPSTAPKDLKASGPGAVFHGKYADHFSLVSDVNFQINARFTGFRPGGRTSDYSWIQALGVLFNQNTFTLEATRVANWDDAVKNMKLTYNEDEIIISEGYLSRWESSDSEIIVERISETNSLLITVSDFAEISVSIVPVLKEDDMIHNDQIQDDNCFGRLEVQFKFYRLSSNAEGLLGGAYQPGPGEAMPFVGEEEKYRTASLLSTECSSCRYSPAEQSGRDDVFSIIDQGTMDYAGGGKQQEWNTM